MATDCVLHTKWHDQEDALSLCDLPLHDRPDSPAPTDEPEQQEFEFEFEFDFGSMCSSVLTDQEMCTADEVFFKGQILPLRLSFSSRTASRSESMDHCSSSGFTSRSSSINSSTSNPYKPKIHNQFHAHPSPTPQIRTSGRTANRSRRWSVWDFFRLGLVQTPEIELEDLKVRTSNYKSSKGDGSIKKRDGLGKSGGFLRGCKCSVETVSFESVMVRSKSTSSSSRNKNKNKNKNKNSESTRDAKQQEMKKKKTRMSRHRTFEWLKELSQSHATTPHHQIIV